VELARMHEKWDAGWPARYPVKLGKT